MFVLMFSQYWHPENGVPQRRWSWLSSILVSEGYKISVVTTYPNYRRNIGWTEWLKHRWLKGLTPEHGGNGEEIYRVPFIPTNSSLTYRAVNQAVIAVLSGFLAAWLVKTNRMTKPDIIIATVPALPTAMVGRLVAKYLKVPYVVDLRDAWPDLLGEMSNWNSSIETRSRREAFLTKGPFKILIPLLSSSFNSILRESSGIIVTSEYLMSKLQERFPLLGNNNKIIVVRNVFPSSIRRKEIFSSSRKITELHVLYAGTLGRAQNLQNVIKAAELAREKGVEVKLRFVGDGASRNSLDELGKLSPVDTEFRPQKDVEGLQEDYEWADSALVHLTDWEPLERAVPSKTYELMSAGIHISAVLSGETAFLIEKLQAGDVVEPENPEALANLWVEIVENPEKLRLNAAGAEWVKCERENNAPKTLKEFLKDVASKKIC